MNRYLIFILSCAAYAQAPSWVSQVRDKPFVDVRQYQFSRTNNLKASGNLSASGTGKTVTLTPCPDGLNGADQNHYLRLSGGVGTAETVLITGGTCTSGASSGTIIFNTANAHSGSWTITSATAGCSEAIQGGTSNGALPVSVWFTAGSYDFYAPCYVQWGRISIVGVGGRAITIITNHHPTLSTFIFNGSGLQTYNRISGLQMVSGAGKTAGWGIEATSQFYFELSDIVIDGLPNGVLLNGCLGVWFYNSAVRSFFNGAGVGIKITGEGAGTDNYYFTNLEVIGGPGLSSTAMACINVVTGGGFLFTNITTYDCRVGLLVNPQAGHEVRWGFITGSNFDSNLGDGVRFEPNAGGTIRSFSFANSWTSSNSSNGVYSEGTNGGLIQGLNFDGFRTLANGLNGAIFGTGTSGTRISGAKAAGNSIADPNVYAGIIFDDGIDDFSVIGSHSGPSDSFGATQGHGIRIAGSGSNNYTIVGNTLLGNTIGLEDQGTGTTKTVEANTVPNSEKFASVPSAATIDLPAKDETTFFFSGTTAIQTFGPVWGGRKVRFIFTSATPGGVATGGTAGRDFAKTVAASQDIPMDCEYVNVKWYCK